MAGPRPVIVAQPQAPTILHAPAPPAIRVGDAPGPPGPPGIRWRGDWDTDTPYFPDDGVQHDGSSWRSLTEHVGTAPPTLPITSNASWALIAAQGDVGPQGPPAAGSGMLGLTAGESIAVGRIVYVGADERLYLLDKDDVAHAGAVIGMANNTAAEGGSIDVLQLGKKTGFAGLTPGQRYWLGAAGGMTPTPPTSGILLPLGVALTSAEFAVDIGEGIIR